MLDPKEEREYEELRKMGQRLHIPIPEAFWELEVRDRDGNVIQTLKQRSHSWTRNAYNHLFCEMAAKNVSDNTFGGGKLSGKNTAGTVKFAAREFCHATMNLDLADATDGILTLAGNINKGILVGSGINAESFEDFVLQTPIGEGAGAGQLNVAASELHAITYVGLVLKDTQIRYFNNNSAGNVSVNEVCIVDGISIAGVKWLFLVSRDKLGATVTVPTTGQLKVTYTIQLTYPA